MPIDFTAISHAVIVVAAGVMALFSILHLLAWRRKLAADTLQAVAGVCHIVVQAVEQKAIVNARAAATPGTGLGAVKKALAIDIIHDILATYGVQVSDDYLTTAVEAAVLTLPHSLPPPSPVTAADPSDRQTTPTNTTEGMGNTVFFQYHPNGTIASATDSDGNTTDYFYHDADKNGALVS